MARSSARRRPAFWLPLALALLALVVGLAGWGYQRLHRAALEELSTRGESTLSLAVAALGGQLRRYDRLPQLLAQQEVVRALLEAPDDPGRVAAANAYLRATAALLEATDIYVMDLSGDTRAASNYDLPRSFMGGNFAFRPYFQDALTRGQGRFYALGTTSRARGYYFGAPVVPGQSAGETPAGVLVIKIDLDAIEASWRGSDYEVIVTDPEDIVFMSTYPAWTFSATRPLTEARLARTRRTRRYAETALRELPIERATGEDGGELWRIADPGAPHEYRVLSEPMLEAGWVVRVLFDTAAARRQALTGIVVAALLAGLGLLTALIVIQRRALQAEARAQLERRVAERTAELAAVNHQLGEEVAERRATEERLRATQADLVQAGKLAALGQMSAALSHEFNQPLGAAQNYAENAQLYIERGRIEEAKGNIERIQGLIGRMGELSKHLRNFARKPGAQLVPVALPEAVAAVQDIVGWRLRALEVALTLDVPPLVVRAGPVRLQQVLVNILSNAIDAVEGQQTRAIHLAARAEGHSAVITIADSGPGIAPQLTERIFDPFFSTKGVGKGLGLGLSISYNIVHDFGGALSVGTGPAGGAVFTLTLPLAE